MEFICDNIMVVKTLWSLDYQQSLLGLSTLYNPLCEFSCHNIKLCGKEKHGEYEGAEI